MKKKKEHACPDFLRIKAEKIAKKLLESLNPGLTSLCCCDKIRDNHSQLGTLVLHVIKIKNAKCGPHMGGKGVEAL